MKLIGVTALALLIVAASAGPVEELNTATRTFAAKLYTELIRTQQNQNVIFSPLTIQTLMALFSSASKDENRDVIKQIRKALNLPAGENNRQAAFKQVLEGLKGDNDFKVLDATKMYFKSGYWVEYWYQNIAQNVYGSEIETVNFGDRWSTSQNINQWVAKKTNNKITNFIDSYDLSENIENLMINTLYLNGKWDVPFDQQNNTVKTFEGSNGARPVTMMNAENSYYYFEDNDAQYLKLEMLRDGGGADMIFVLPNKTRGISLSRLESNVHNLLETKPFELNIVNVTLPKFTFSNDIKLVPVLKNLNMKTVFDVGTVLEGLRYSRNRWSRITDMLQKAFIEVNEWGVSASVAIYDKVDVDDPLVDKKNFIADHPFLFYITVDNAVLFAGRVMQV